MARRKVTELDCSRCKRTEVQTDKELKNVVSPEFSIALQGKKVEYADLCTSCRKTLTNAFERLTKVKSEKESPDKPDKHKVSPPLAKTT